MLERRGVAAPALALALVLALTACSSPDGDAPPEGPTGSATTSVADVAWEEVVLPVPPGPAGRIAVRETVHCGSTWYAVGGVFRADGFSRPAWWSSADGRTWQSRRLDPKDLFAKGAVLSTVGCSGDAIAALGSRPGGAHGNPRTTSWYVRDDGVLVDVPAVFTQYGGVEAVNTAQLVGGPAGFTISGNRTSGAAVWSSPDGREFVRNDTDPALRHDGTQTFLANDQAPVGQGWVLVGGVSGSTGAAASAPQAWSTTDGRTWAREDVPASDEFGDLERVVADGDELVALGLRGDGYGVWQRDPAGTWRAGASFGGLDPDRRGAPAVSGVAATGTGLLVATVSDGVAYRTWVSPDGADWREVASPPDAPTAASGHVMTVATDGALVTVVADDGDDGDGGHLWLADAGALGG